MAVLHPPFFSGLGHESLPSADCLAAFGRGVSAESKGRSRKHEAGPGKRFCGKRLSGGVAPFALPLLDHNAKMRNVAPIGTYLSIPSGTFNRHL